MAVNAASVLALVRFGNVTFKDNAYHCPLGQYADYAFGTVSETNVELRRHFNEIVATQKKTAPGSYPD